MFKTRKTKTIDKIKDKSEMTGHVACGYEAPTLLKALFCKC